MAAPTPNIYEEYEQRLETKALIELCDLKHIRSWIAKQESLLAHFVEGQQRNEAQGQEGGLGRYLEDSIDQLLEDLRDEIDRGQKIAKEMERILGARQIYTRPSFPIATHTPAAE